MEPLLANLNKLSTSKRIIQPEQAILQSLINFDLILPRLSNEADHQINQLEKALFELLKINNGELSVQCSISIAFRLTKLFSKMNDPPVSSTISDLINKLNQASTVAIGEIFNRVSSRCTSQIPKAIESILLLPEDLKYHSLFALRGIFKSKAQLLSQYCQPVYKYLRKSIDVTPESNQIIALKLMKAILEFDSNYYNYAVECTDACLFKQQTPFVRYQAGNLVAFCALSISKGKDGLKGAFALIQKYSNYLSPIINRFVELLPSEMIAKNTNELFSLVRQTSPNDINVMSPYLSKSDKQTLFGMVLSERKPSASQLVVLRAISIDDGDILACAGAALQLARSTEVRDREAAAFFFSKLTKSNQDIAQHYLQNSIVEMTRIKTQEVTMANYVTVVAILEANSSLILPYKQIIDEYINAITSLTDYASVRYSALWSILSFAPKEFLAPNNEKLSGPLSKISDILNSTTTFDSKWETILDGLLMFYSKHTSFTRSDIIFQHAQTNIAKLSDISFTYFIRYVIEGRRNCDSLINLITSKAIASYPGKEFLKSEIGRVVDTADDLIISKVEEIPSARYLATQTAIINFPEILKCCQSQPKDVIISNLISQTTTTAQMLVAHSMLLSIINDDTLADSLPRNFIGLILKTLRGSDYLRIQLTCEVVSKAIERQPAMIEALFKFIEMNKRVVSCFIISSLISRLHISKQLLSRYLLFIDERLFSHYSAPFALHALSTALTTHAEDFYDLGLGGQHINLLLKLLHDSTSLHPIIIHMISAAFIELVPIVSKDNSMNTNIDILSIVESIRSTPYTFAKGVYYNTISSIAQVSYPIASMIPVEFPKSEKTPFSILLAASEAYSMIGIEPISAHIPNLLLAISRTSSPMAVRASGKLLSRENGNYLLLLIRSVFINNVLPPSNVTPNNKVRLAVLEALAVIFETITINEASLIAMALCSAAASGTLELQSLAFPMLSALLARFQFANLKEHFGKLIPIAFKLSFNISGGFLVSFMNKENLPLCFSALATCTNDSPEYFAMFTRALKISRESAEPSDAVKKFAPIIQPKLNNIVNQIIKSPSSTGSYQAIFVDLWQSFVYVNYVIGSSKNNIPPKVLLSYFIVELNKCSSYGESWKVNGFIFGASALLQYYLDEITSESESNLTKEIIEAAVNNLPTLKGQIDGSLAELLKFASRYKDLDESSWENVIFSIVNADFEAETAARAINHFTSQFLDENIFELANSFLNKVHRIGKVDKNEEEEKTIALFKILLAKLESAQSFNTIVSLTIEWSLKTPNSSQYAFRLLSLVIIKIAKRKNDDEEIALDYDVISDFAVKRFRRGGLNFVANIICHDEKVGLQIAARGPIGCCAALITRDPANAVLYIKFLVLVQKKVGKEEMVKSLLAIALQTVTKGSISPAETAICAQIFKTVEKENSELFKEFWETQNEADRELCVRNILDVAS